LLILCLFALQKTGKNRYFDFEFRMFNFEFGFLYFLLNHSIICQRGDKVRTIQPSTIQASRSIQSFKNQSILQSLNRGGGEKVRNNFTALIPLTTDVISIQYKKKRRDLKIIAVISIRKKH